MPQMEVPCPKCGERHTVLLTQANIAAKTDFICLGCGANVIINDGVPSINDMRQKIDDAVKMAFGRRKTPPRS